MSWAYNIGVIGAGDVGSAVAHKMAREGLNVILFDHDQNKLAKGLQVIHEDLSRAIEKGVISKAKADQARARIKGSTMIKDIAEVDLVVEAAYENLVQKLELLRELDRLCGDNTIIACSTSGGPVSDLAIQSGRPDRFIGLHYVSNPAKNRLVEIIPHEGTSEDTIKKAQVIARVQGKTAILVKDVPGFAINRLFMALLSEAFHIYEEKIANKPTIEEAARRAFYYDKGPFEQIKTRDSSNIRALSELLCREDKLFCLPPEQLASLDYSVDAEGPIDISKLGMIAERLYAAVFATAAKLIENNIALSIEDIDRGAGKITYLLCIVVQTKPEY